MGAGDSGIGVDIGGSTIAAGVVDRDGRVSQVLRRPTPPAGAAAVLDAVTALVAELTAGRDAAEIAGVGVGARGVIDPVAGVVRSAGGAIPGWAGTRLRAELADRTGLPVRVDNDVRALACGEARFGAGRAHPDALYVSVGTGVGGALTRAGALVHGDHGTAGEIGHLLSPVPGRLPCGCGRLDHVESVAAGPAIAADYAARSGVAVPLPEVVTRLRIGDPEARAALTGAATVLGRVLAGLATAIDLNAVIVGGGVAEIGADFLSPLTAALRAEIRPPGRDIPVLPAELGVEGPIVGAVALFFGPGGQVDQLARSK